MHFAERVWRPYLTRHYTPHEQQPCFCLLLYVEQCPPQKQLRNERTNATAMQIALRYKAVEERETFLRGDLFFFFLQQVTLRTCFFLRCFFKNKNSSLFVKGRDYEQARVQTMKTIGQNPLLDLCETKECQNLLFFTYRICFLVTEKKILLSIHRK